MCVIVNGFFWVPVTQLIFLLRKPFLQYYTLNFHIISTAHICLHVLCKKECCELGIQKNPQYHLVNSWSYTIFKVFSS